MSVRPWIYRITAQPRDLGTGNATPVYMAGGGDRCPYRFDLGAPLGRVHFRAGVVDVPRFHMAIGFNDNGWTGGVIPTTGEVRWAPTLAADYATFCNSYLWTDADIKVERGTEGADGSAPAAWEIVLIGTIANMSAEDGALSFTIADLSQRLNKPIITGKFAGTGGLEGPTEAEGRPKRRTWGKVFNVEGRLLDKANSIYEFGDPNQKLQSFPDVRDMGRSAAPAPTVLAWQGSVAATFAALQAASAAQGSCVVAPSIACIKWWTVPAGPLTADIQGEVGAAYSELAGTIAQNIVAAAGLAAVANADRDSLNALRPDSVGIHINAEQTTWANALDDLLSGISIVWVVGSDGQVRFFPFDFSNPVESLTAQASNRQKVLPAAKSRKLGYQRNYRQHSDGEIAASLLVGDVSGLGALATQNNVDLATQLTDSGSGSPTITVPRNEIRTPLGTAAAIAGQGVLATRDNADWDAGQIIGTKRPSDFAGTTLTLTSVGADTNCTIQGNLFYRNAAGDGGPNVVRSAESFDGGAAVTATGYTTLPGNGISTYIGFTTNAAATAVADMAFGVRALATGSSFVYRVVNGVVTQLVGLTCTENDVFSVTYDGAQGRIYQNGSLIYSTTLAAGLKYYLLCASSRGRGGAKGILFSPYNSVGRLGTSIWNAAASLLLGDADAITALGTASAIAGQGALATKSAVTWNTGDLSGTPTYLTDGRVGAGFDVNGDLARNITSTRRDLSNLLGRTGGGVFAGELTADQTSTHTAQAITGQGALATRGNVSISQLPIIEGANIVQDPVFAFFNDPTAPSWSTISNGGTVPITVDGSDAASAAMGVSRALKYQSAGSAMNGGPRANYGTAQIPVFAGERYRIRLKTYVEAGFNGQFTIGAFCYGPTGAFVSSISALGANYKTTPAGANTLETIISAPLPIAAGTATIQPFIQVAWSPTLAPAGNAYAATPEIRKFAQLNDMITRETGALLTDALAVTSLGTASGIAGQGTFATKSSADPSTAEILARGSIPTTIPGQSFTYTSNTNSVLISWPTITLYRADGTTVTVSSGSQNITGLASATTYKVYPYVTDGGGTTGTVSFVTSGTAAGAGSPSACFNLNGDAGAAAGMYLRSRIPLNGFQVATTSSGTGGGGGGGLSCLHPDTAIGGGLAKDLQIGSGIDAPGGTAKVASIGRRPCSEWFIVRSHGVELARVSRDHRFHLASGGEIKVQDIRLGTLLAAAGDHVEVTGLELSREVAELVSIELPEPHLYYLGPLKLKCHNPKP